MESSGIDDIDWSINHIQTWLQANEENQKVVPVLRKVLRVLLWEREAIASMPDRLRTILPYDFGSLHNTFRINLENHLPKLPPVDPLYFESSLSSTASLSSGVLMVFNPELDMTDEENMWVISNANSYSKLEEELNFPTEISSMLERLDPRLKEMFDLSEKSFYQFRKKELDTYSGTAMRNVLEGFKGRLFASAMQANEQHIKWEAMVDRLSNYAKGTLEYQLLLRQEQNWEDIHKNLSDLLKNRTTSEYGINQAHINLISHMYVVLSLIRIE
jgi:hypothetical protein